MKIDKKTILLLLLLPVFLFSKNISAKEAKNYIGKEATVCGKVFSSYYAQRSNGAPTFLNLDRTYPNQIFTVVIWDTYRELFGTPEHKYLHKNICVSGYIQSYRGTPQITAESPSQISIR